MKERRSLPYRPTSKLSTKKRWAWKVFSDYIRQRDQWTCFTCGTVAYGRAMHAGHFIPRTKSGTYFHEHNVHAQCYSCNIWKRGNAGEYADRLIRTYGKSEFDALLQASRNLHKFTHEELEGIYQTYRAKNKEAGFPKGKTRVLTPTTASVNVH